jgi:hypothetical protein
MSEAKSAIRFEPVEWKILPEWYVRVTLPNGKQLRIGGFENEVKAREWIAKSSAGWIKVHKERRRS